jgi:hypothetical protein
MGWMVVQIEILEVISRSFAWVWGGLSAGSHYHFTPDPDDGWVETIWLRSLGGGQSREFDIEGLDDVDIEFFVFWELIYFASEALSFIFFDVT